MYDECINWSSAAMSVFMSAVCFVCCLFRRTIEYSRYYRKITTNQTSGRWHHFFELDLFQPIKLLGRVEVLIRIALNQLAMTHCVYEISSFSTLGIEYRTKNFMFDSFLLLLFKWYKYNKYKQNTKISQINCAGLIFSFKVRTYFYILDLEDVKNVKYSFQRRTVVTTLKT